MGFRWPGQIVVLGGWVVVGVVGEVGVGDAVVVVVMVLGMEGEVEAVMVMTVLMSRLASWYWFNNRFPSTTVKFFIEHRVRWQAQVPRLVSQAARGFALASLSVFCGWVSTASFTFGNGLLKRRRVLTVCHGWMAGAKYIPPLHSAAQAGSAQDLSVQDPRESVMLLKQ